MPKLKARITITSPDTNQHALSGTLILDDESPITAMSKFYFAADEMLYTGPVTNENPPRD